MNKLNLTLALLFTPTISLAAPINSLNISGGDFSLSGSTSINPLTPGAFSNLTIGGYDGSAPINNDFGSTSVATADFETFGPIGIYTSSSDDVSTGFAPVSGDVTNGVLTLDLSSWTVWWNGTNFNQGSSSSLGAAERCYVTINTTKCSTAIIVDTFDELTGEFSAHWDALALGGATNGELYNWNITGTVSAVPVPAAVWLFGSGLIALAGLAKRKKQ